MFVMHSKTVTSLCFSSSDNVTLVSGLMDGWICVDEVWDDVLTRQCLNEYYPLG